MKQNRLTPLFLYVPTLSAVLALSFAPASGARDTGNTGSDQKTRDRKGPPVELKVDRQPIDRNAPDRVSYAPIVKKTAASVVHVYTTRQVRGPALPRIFDDPMFRRFFDIPGSRGARPQERTQRGLGSGVIISSSGYVVTNHHVIEGADEVKVAIGDNGKRYEATIVGSDPLADLAVLEIKPDTELTAATFGDSEQLEVGDVVLAIGNPFGIGQSVSRGIVSAVDRGNLGIEAIEDFIQTDAAINRGNSGGALIDNLGRLVGINTAIVSGSGGFAGVGFAIPSNLVRGVAEQIINTGQVNRGFLGVAPQRLTPELAAQFGTDRGALVAQVTTDGPAEAAGLEAGDIITKVGETEIRDPRHLLLTVSQLAPGTEVTIEYRRDGETKTATLKLASRPGQEQAAAEDGEGDEGVLQGVAVADITDDVRSQFQIPERIEGAIITRVDPNSAAALQGLREGDVILQLNREPIKDARAAARLSKQITGPKVLVLVWREGRSQFLVIDESAK